MTVITSRDNPELKRLSRLLASRQARREEGMFVAEGLRICMETLSAPVEVEAVYFSETFAQKHPQPTALLSQKAARSRFLSDQAAARLGDTKTPQGVFCLCRALDNRVQLSKIKDARRFVLLSSLQDPGNVGTILRTADALGIDGVILSADCPEVTSPKVLRATMGGVFRQPIMVAPSLEEVADLLRQEGFDLCAAALTRDARPLGETPFGQRAAVVIGNEGNGLSPQMIARCSRSVIIPMAREGQSLNAAAAACILMWELARSR